MPRQRHSDGPPVGGGVLERLSAACSRRARAGGRQRCGAHSGFSHSNGEHGQRCRIVFPSRMVAERGGEERQDAGFRGVARDRDLPRAGSRPCVSMDGDGRLRARPVGGGGDARSDSLVPWQAARDVDRHAHEGRISVDSGRSVRFQRHGSVHQRRRRAPAPRMPRASATAWRCGPFPKTERNMLLRSMSADAATRPTGASSP